MTDEDCRLRPRPARVRGSGARERYASQVSAMNPLKAVFLVLSRGVLVAGEQYLSGAISFFVACPRRDAPRTDLGLCS